MCVWGGCTEGSGKGFPEDSSAPGLEALPAGSVCREGMEGGGHPAELQCQLPKTWSHPIGVQQHPGWGLDLGLSWHRAQWD